MAHALLSPSSMDRILSCPASLAESDGQPDNGNKYAWEGTAAHTLLAWCLERKLPAIAFLGVIIPVEENGVWVADFEADEEMTGNVQITLDAVSGYMQVGDCDLFIEQKVNFSRIVEVPGSDGTSDIIIAYYAARELHVNDFKYGRGVKVDAEENGQMMTYGLAALEALEALGDFDTVRLTIHQPRLNHISDWVISVADLKAWGDGKLKEGCNLAITLLELRKQDPNVVIDPSYYNPDPVADNCRFCKGKARCKALENFVVDALGCTFEDLDATIQELDDKPAPITPPEEDARLDALFPKLDMIMDWCSAIRGRIYERLMAGATGYTNARLGIGRKGNSKWTDEKLAEEKLKSMRLKQEDMYSMNLVSPTQAAKLLKDTPKRLKVIKALITQADGKPSVVPMDDAAKPYEVAKADFDNLDDVGDLV